MYKNTKHTVTIASNGAGGEGIAKIEGYTVFVPYTVKGDVCEILIVKENKSFGYGKLINIITPSPDRLRPPCDIFGKCGGCDIQEMEYSAQLEFKRLKVRDAIRRIGGFSDFEVNEVVPSPHMLNYRNKAQYPVSVSKGGKPLVYGFYAPHSHRVVSCDDCKLQDKKSNEIASTVIKWANDKKITAYNEADGSGILRHICIRSGKEETVLVLVVKKNTNLFDGLSAFITEKFPYVTGIIENINPNMSNVIYGAQDKVLYGKPYIYESIGDIKYKVHYKSFFQVNPYTTKLLYEKVRSLCKNEGNKTLFDIYCGIGTIGLFTAKHVKKVIGIEVIPEAVENAKENAKINNIHNAHFYCGKAEDEVKHLSQNGTSADIVVLDPPRKGCEKSLIDTICTMNPEKIIYVSCDCATLARDIKIFASYGYIPNKATVFDQFPQTNHVETVVLLSQRKPDDRVRVKIDLDDYDLTKSESKATYEEIKEYVLKHSCLKVSSLNIAQVKQKHRIIERENYNKAKSADAKQPQCTKDKEKAITEALKHFRMI